MRIRRIAAAILAPTLLLAIMLSLISTFSCANQAPPGGGPEDRTPPELTGAFPRNGAVNVRPDTSITLLFSERIAAAASAVKIYPEPAGGFGVKVAGNRLEVTPRRLWEANTTYLVVVSTALKDLRGNAVADRVTLLFSTGDSVDESIMDVLREKADTSKIDVADADTSEFDASDADSLKIGVSDADTSKIDAFDADSLKLGVSDIDTSEFDALGVDTPNVDESEADSLKPGAD